MEVSTKILLLQQNDGARRARSLVFGGAYFHSLQLGDEDAVQNYLNHEKVDVILNDCRGAEAKGLQWVESLRKEQPKAKVVLLTEAMDLPMVIKSIRLGVKDVFAGPLDIGVVSRRLGEIAGGGDAAIEALGKADWSSLQEFFRPGGDAAPKASPPSGRRSSKSAAASEDLESERKHLGEESRKLKEQMDELDKRRAEVEKAEKRIKEKDTGKSAASSDEVALRRERESLRMQVMELESERDLLQRTLAEKEEALRIANASVELLKSGQSTASVQQTPPPFAFQQPAGTSEDLNRAQEALATAQQEAAQVRLRLAEVEQQLADRETALAQVQAESLRLREQLGQCEKERDQARDFLSAKEKALANATSTLQRLQAEMTDYERRLRESKANQAGDAAAQEAARAEREQRVAQLAALEAERDFLKGQIEAMEVELDATRATVDRLQREASDFSSQLSDATRSPLAAQETLLQEREQLLAKVARLESERNLAREQYTAREKALATANAGLSRLQGEVSELERKLREAAQAQNQNLDAAARAEREQRVAQLATLEAERDFLRQQVEALETDLSGTRADVERLQREAAEFNARLDEASRPPMAEQASFREEREQLLARLARLESERNLAREQYAAREKALSQANAGLQRLQSELTECERKLREATQNQNLSLDAAQRAEREQRVAQLAALEAERDFLRSQVSTLEADLNGSRETIELLQREAAEFTHRLEEESRKSQSGDESLRHEREQLLAKIARLESERNLARDQFAAREKALAEANTTVQKLRHELVQVTQKARERDTMAPFQVDTGSATQRQLDEALERLGLLELERDNARDQLAAKDAALDIANQTVESLRGEVERYAERLLQAAPAPAVPISDDGVRAERDQLRQRLAKAERERDQARELLKAKERAHIEAVESLKRLRMEGDLTAARSIEQIARREAELASAEQHLLNAQQEVQEAKDKMDEAWATLHLEQEKVTERKRQLDDQAVALANRERMVALERSRQTTSTGAEAIGASERRLRLLRTELASLASALNEREAALRTQENRVEQLLLKADTDLRSVQSRESLLDNRASEIEQRIAAAEARAAEIIAVAKARADAEERAHAGLSEALRRERESVRKAEARYLSACNEVGEQLQALADREAAMRRREFQLDERENSIRQVLQRVLSDANALVRGESAKNVFAAEQTFEGESAGKTLQACDAAKSEMVEQRRAFGKKSKRLAELTSELDQEPPRNS